MGGQLSGECHCCTRWGGPPPPGSGEDFCSSHRPGPSWAPPREEGLPSSEVAPAWLAALTPGLAGEEAKEAANAWAQCAEDLRRRTRQFLRTAICGVPCRLIDAVAGRAAPARYTIDEAVTQLSVEEESGEDRSARGRVTRCCSLARVQNIWVCKDSELARRTHATLHPADGLAPGIDPACFLLLDSPAGPIGLFESSVEAREDFLDCMASLIAACRLRSEPESASRLPGAPPPPEARLRPIGTSLRSVHLSGPICKWLAHTSEDLLPPAADGCEGAQDRSLKEAQAEDEGCWESAVCREALQRGDAVVAAGTANATCTVAEAPAASSAVPQKASLRGRHRHTGPVAGAPPGAAPGPRAMRRGPPVLLLGPAPQGDLGAAPDEVWCPPQFVKERNNLVLTSL
mmetsp:Transcript_121049/g.258466  ORF Transcript_121049/g.258466 Transcript_121049/m.258466 type:complete len:402 (+) Transcript_121049:104-1309(+)